MLKELSTEGFSTPSSPFQPGPFPMLQWVEVQKLVVDPEYQREMSRRGVSNVRRISENFDWSKFAPVIVAPVEGGRFAVVDGQHRTTAAMLRGIESVPCQVVQADRAKQAEAFAAVNGHVTKTTPQQLFHARLTAGDPQAKELAEVCAAAEVFVTRRNLVQAKMRKGQTQAVGALRRCLDTHGRETLITALQCVTQTGDGNPGWVRATVVEALCEVLGGNVHWRDAGGALLQAMDNFDFSEAWDEAMAGRNFILAPAVQHELAERVRKHLTKALKPAKAKAA